VTKRKDGGTSQSGRTGHHARSPQAGLPKDTIQSTVSPETNDEFMSFVTKQEAKLMSSLKTQLFRLIQRGNLLERQSLLDGFASYQDWRNDVHELFQMVQADFDQIVQTPLDVANGIRFIERTFQVD
jgi:hypothetical protein